jgi:tRNA (uracil-5-)-methyltransferase
MNCTHFGVCGSCTVFDPYDQQIHHKAETIKRDFDIDELDILPSPDTHYRVRSEFRIYHDGDQLSYAMHDTHKKVLPIEHCPKVDPTIYKLMPLLLKELVVDSMLSKKLFAVEFVTASTDETLITLIYHKKIDESWKQAATPLAHTLGIKLIGRSRKVKIVIGDDTIDEILRISGRAYHYKLHDGSFIQPNRTTNEKMIAWVKNHSANLHGDLLELYCGHGNFTLPLCENFDNVLATEVSKSSIRAAHENATLNNIDNVAFIRLSAEETTQALTKKREFTRIKEAGVDLESYRFSTVLVDPPRSGLDEHSLALVQRFQHILYISCSPTTLLRDLERLKQNYTIMRFALFDQFPHTHHMECGVILSQSHH